MIATKTTHAFEPMKKMHHLSNYLLRSSHIQVVYHHPCHGCQRACTTVMEIVVFSENVPSI